MLTSYYKNVLYRNEINVLYRNILNINIHTSDFFQRINSRSIFIINATEIKWNKYKQMIHMCMNRNE